MACSRVNFPGVERLGREDQHLLPSGMEAKNESYISNCPIDLYGVYGDNTNLPAFPIFHVLLLRTLTVCCQLLPVSACSYVICW